MMFQIQARYIMYPSNQHAERFGGMSQSFTTILAGDSRRQNCACPCLFDSGEGLVFRTIVLPDVGQPVNENGRRHLPATFCRESDLLHWRNSTKILWINQAAPGLLVISSLSITAWISVFRFVAGPGKSDDGPVAASRRSYLLVVNKSDRVGEIHPAMNQ